VFENKVFRKIFGPEKDKVTGGWRELHNEELHSLYSSPSMCICICNYNDKVKEDEIGREYSTNGGEVACIEDTGEKAGRKETIGKTMT
jgi:hypothetical protein